MKAKPTNRTGLVTFELSRRDEPWLDAATRTAIKSPFRLKRILVPQVGRPPRTAVLSGRAVGVAGIAPCNFERRRRADALSEKILANILSVARRRPVVIQSLFPSIGGEAPPGSEIEAYVQRLWELKDAGAQIPLVQIYSATRPTEHPECGHLPLRTLSHIAQRVREVSGLKAEVF